MERPDLTNATPEVLVYIEYLEGRISSAQPKKRPSAESEPSEPPTSINVIAISDDYKAKRTPRHFYGRQRRGGMGVFDLDTPEDAPAMILALADEADAFILFSNFGRAFRLNASDLVETAVRAAGHTITDLLPFRPHEKLVAALPDGAGAQVALVSSRGRVRKVRGSFLGKSLIPGMNFHNVQEGGYLVDACWTTGQDELFIATKLGKGIRFRETQVHSNGTLGLRVDVDDAAVAITAVTESSGVFMLTSNGKGTVRQMSGFRMNKAPGAGGKVVMKTDDLVAAYTVSPNDDIFAISQTSKIIRFSANEIPQKEGVVQGVNCMSLRNDRVTAVTISPQ